MRNYNFAATSPNHTPSQYARDTATPRAVARCRAAQRRVRFLASTESQPGAKIEGVVNRAVDLASGRHALIERSRDFTLVPWRPVLEKHIGKSVSGIVRGDGISWTIGRERGGPSIS